MMTQMKKQGSFYNAALRISSREVKSSCEVGENWPTRINTGFLDLMVELLPVKFV